ncbi:MAG TPA: hypothetical protein VFX05_17160 [Casimicrobiaceae bacterium]|nr:hypothetical protein [Casimicrobiaceae bacterium]
MKKSLFAVAVAGVLATGVAAADNAVIRFDNGNARVYSVQDRWWDHGQERRYDNNPRDDGRQLDVDTRQARLQERIRRGFDNGRLTPREAQRMQRQLSEIEAKQRAFESDGRLGPREARELQDDMDRLASRMRSQLRDDDRRY